MLRLLTGRQVEHDANRGRVVDDVRPLVQVVHVIAAVIATVTKHQLQHQVLWESQKKDRQKVRKVNAMTTKMFRTSCRAEQSPLFDYGIIRVPREAVWTEHTESSAEIITLESSILNLLLLLQKQDAFCLYKVHYLQIYIIYILYYVCVLIRT